VLGVEDFLSSNVPAWLSGEKAHSIYQEIKELTMSLVEEEQQRQGGRRIDLFDAQDEEGEVIKQKALDQICMHYKIEEEQLKHVLYITFVVPN
jgi:hypothetical protein